MRSDEQGAMIRRLRFTGLRPQRKSNMTFFYYRRGCGEAKNGGKWVQRCENEVTKHKNRQKYEFVYYFPLVTPQIPCNLQQKTSQ